MATSNRQAPPMSQQVSDDYKLLLTKPFSTMTKITDNLFLTGIGGMTKANFVKNHIDFVVNITTDAPLWPSVESMRLAFEDDVSTDMLSHLDHAVDKINEAISQRNAHVLVHCIAGVSRSATVVVAYLMKFRRLDLRTAFNYCYNLRPIIRPNNGFMKQLIEYEEKLFGRPSRVKMILIDVEGTVISVPDFFLEEHPKLVLLEVLRGRDLARSQTPPPPVTSSPKQSSASPTQPGIPQTTSHNNLQHQHHHHQQQQQHNQSQQSLSLRKAPRQQQQQQQQQLQQRAQLNLPQQPSSLVDRLRLYWQGGRSSQTVAAKEAARSSSPPRSHKATKSSSKPPTKSGET